MRLYCKRLGQFEKTESCYVPLDGIGDLPYENGHVLTPDEVVSLHYLMDERRSQLIEKNGGYWSIPSCDYYDSIYYDYILER